MRSQNARPSETQVEENSESNRTQQHVTSGMAGILQPSIVPGFGRAALVVKHGAIVEVSQLLAANDGIFAIIFDFGNARVTLHVQDFQIRHLLQHVENITSLDLVVLNVQNPDHTGEVRRTASEGENKACASASKAHTYLRDGHSNTPRTSSRVVNRQCDMMSVFKHVNAAKPSIRWIKFLEKLSVSSSGIPSKFLILSKQFSCKYKCFING
jgi:hypothetical protein